MRTLVDPPGNQKVVGCGYSRRRKEYYCGERNIQDEIGCERFYKSGMDKM